MALATYEENGTMLSIDLKAPIAEARRLGAADPLTRGTKLVIIRGYGSYRKNAASGGTDTGSGHVDFNAEGMTDAQAQRWVLYLRRVGIMAYFRRRSWWSSWLGRLRVPGWQRHVHCGLYKSADASKAMRDQWAEWLAGGDGLSGPEPDDGDRRVVGRTYAQYVALMAAAVTNVGQTVAVAARVKLIQKALRLKVDGVWGPQTDAALWQMWIVRKEGRARFVKYNATWRKTMQRQWGARVIDGVWGSQTQAANLATVKVVQKALGVVADGVWGPVTDRAYRALRAKAYRP
ncbi:peptidoglycan-binding domain-containing protein [Intrasporangium flavum]|uniref:peptidoglycan-binding domain-containing protein n=1 Tax=Intrasporangium flavum TaxID=1428657 RepID=UPI00096C44B7|nr:hypothetical protein [Intrasporangium flavum]